MRMCGRLYYRLLGYVSHAASNEAIHLGMSRARFEVEFFNDSGGFRVNFEGSPENLTLSWRDVTTRCQEVIFFGRRLEGARPYDALLRDKAALLYTHHVFRQFADELRGDAPTSALLYAAY